MTPGTTRHRGSSRKATLALAAFSTALAGGAGIASGSGGIGTPAPPALADARCLERCLDERTVAETGVAELSGRNLDSVKAVKLPAADGRIELKPRKVSGGRIEFVVPRKAQSGKPVVVDRYGNRARSPERLAVRPADSIEEVEGFNVKRTEATPAKSFFNGKRQSQVDYMFEADGPTDVRINVLKGKRGKLVDTIVQRDREPFTSNEATWNGLTAKGRVAPSSSRYRFEVEQMSGGSGSRARFKYFDHKFPLRARHTYGDGLGAGRNHQGQDVFGRCGAKVVAARGGRVQVRAYHSAAGYYVVIDGRKTGRDYAYMHLQKRGRPKEGQRVHTGDVIGRNGDTGNASGCHLHFELWSAPGWYEGGKPLSPTKALKRWDSWS